MERKTSLQIIETLLSVQYNKLIRIRNDASRCICILGGYYRRHQRTKNANYSFLKKKIVEAKSFGFYEYRYQDEKYFVQTFLFYSGVGIELLEGFERLVLLLLFTCLLFRPSRELSSLQLLEKGAYLPFHRFCWNKGNSGV